jgi:rhamnulokinase
MSNNLRLLAFDFGAESGRAVVGTLQDGHIALEELHRFPTEGIVMLGTRQWDVTRIYDEMLTALSQYVERYGPKLDGIGCDTWGVDFGLIANDGSLLGNPVHYRDSRTDGMIEEACKIVSREEIYRMTGIAFHPFNTLYQLLALTRSKASVLNAAESLLLMGDLFAYLLCGVKSCDYTNASTTQLLDPFQKTWSEELLDKMQLPKHLLLEPASPGTVLGPILPDVAEMTGLDPSTPVIAPGTHDTASAVAAVPVTEPGDDWVYLSSGTWSLFGAELDAPHVTRTALEDGFTNEGGVGNKIRFLKNIIGLWLIQECRRKWNREGDQRGYAELTEEAAESPAFKSVIDADDPSLFAPEDMTEAISALCRKTGQPVPETKGAMVRCALESLALQYRRTLRGLDRELDRTTKRLHIIGGGTQNKVLNQMAADACGIPVYTGPVEATGLGNIAVQAMALGAFSSLDEARQSIASSIELEKYEPQNTEAWEEVDSRAG